MFLIPCVSVVACRLLYDVCCLSVVLRFVSVFVCWALFVVDHCCVPCLLDDVCCVWFVGLWSGLRWLFFFVVCVVGCQLF